MVRRAAPKFLDCQTIGGGILNEFLAVQRPKQKNVNKIQE